MHEHERDQDRRLESRTSDHGHNDRGNTPVGPNHRSGLNPTRPQVHQLVPAQPQFPPPHRDATTQTRYGAGYINAPRANGFGNATGGQQYYGDTNRRSTTPDDFASLRESRPQRLPGFTPHRDPFQYMPRSATQYPRAFTTRAELGSNVGQPSPDTFNNRPVDDPDPDIYARSREILQSLSRLDRESANPQNYPPASTGGYLYPQTLNTSSEQLSHASNVLDLATHPTTNGHRVASTRGSFHPHVPQASLGRSSTQSSNTLAAPQHRQAMQYLPTRGNSSTASDDPSSRAQYGRPAPSGPHSGRRRGQP